MNRVLFVDDEPRLLSGLRRALWSRRDQWDMVFEASGRAALERLDDGGADVVVSDFRMPEMDGGEFLDEVRRRSPGTVRLVLSGHTEERDLLGLVDVAHQFLVKPCPPEALVGVLDRVLAARAGFAPSGLRTTMSGLASLPCSPTAVHHLEQAVHGGGNDDILDTIEGDVGLATKVLQLVNSSFFATGRRVTSLEEAVGRLGPAVLRGVSEQLGRTVAADGTAGGGELDGLESHALATARQARAGLRGDRKAADDAFCAGLLHITGPLAVSSCAGRDPVPVRDRKTVAGVGAYLLHLWGLPAEIVESATRSFQSCRECAA